MANVKLRMQSPYGMNDASQYNDDAYFPDPPWGDGGSSDYPTVLSHWGGTDSGITRTVQMEGNTTYTLPNQNHSYGFNTENFWTARSEADCYKVRHWPKHRVHWLYGHKGPASSNSIRRSFQRNVVGLSWQFKTGDASHSKGLEPKNVMLLYRKKEYSNKFYGAWLIKDGNWASGTKRFSQGTIWNKTQNGSYPGKISVNLSKDNAVYQDICSSNCCFQGIWFEMEAMDATQAQVDLYYKMWNVRLIYLDSDQRYAGTRIVLPRNWQFNASFDRAKPLRLT